MARGIGNDIIEVHRIEKSISRHGQHFLDRVFTKKEQAYCLKYDKSARHFAGRFAAKEAIVKALGTGIRGDISWTDIEILNDANGQPHVSFSEALDKKLGTPKILISISHCHEYASAVAIRV